MVDSKVNISVNIKGTQPQIQRIKKQDEDDHWISEEELYTEGSSDEEKPSNSSRKHLKGTSYEEILKKESDLMEMKNWINRLEEALANDKVIREIYDVGKISVVSEGEKIAEKIAEIKNLDKALKIKTEEMKTVKQERLREAEESTHLLMELAKSETSESVKSNSEQFLKLLQNEVRDDTGDNGASRASRVVRRDKAKIEDTCKKPGTFIERNIQLAKCGDGVLSLTDEEKLRLKIVLQDIDDSASQPDRIPTDNQYTLNDELKKTLEEIDRKLQENEKTKFPLNSLRSYVMSTTTLKEDDEGKEKVKPKVPRSVDKELKKLRELDKLLNTLNTDTNEVINPLLDEDLQYLIDESRQMLGTEYSKKPSKETMVELVTAAKTRMPNFRFRNEY